MRGVIRTSWRHPGRYYTEIPNGLSAVQIRSTYSKSVWYCERKHTCYELRRHWCWPQQCHNLLISYTTSKSIFAVLELPRWRGWGFNPLAHWSDPLALINLNPSGEGVDIPPADVTGNEWFAYCHTSSVCGYFNIFWLLGKILALKNLQKKRLFKIKILKFRRRGALTPPTKGPRRVPPKATYSAPASIRPPTALNPLAVFGQFEHCILAYFWIRKHVPNGDERCSYCCCCCCSWGCYYQIFNVLRLFHFTTDRH